MPPEWGLLRRVAGMPNRWDAFGCVECGRVRALVRPACPVASASEVRCCRSDSFAFAGERATGLVKPRGA